MSKQGDIALSIMEDMRVDAYTGAFGDWMDAKANVLNWVEKEIQLEEMHMQEVTPEPALSIEDLEFAEQALRNEVTKETGGFTTFTDPNASAQRIKEFLLNK